MNPFVTLSSTPAPAGGISGILTDVGTLVNQAITWVTSFVNVITSNPLLELFVITSFVGLGVGLIRRIIRL